MREKKIVWIELLRIISCFAVIMLHMGAQHFHDIPIGSFSWNWSNVYHGITRFAVDCFVMISGCLYLHENRKWTFKKVLNYIFPLVVAFIFWQFFYAAFRIVQLSEIELFSVESFKKICVMMTSSYFHLWYIPMQIGLILVAPLLWKIVNGEDGRQWEEFFLVLFFLFQIIPNTIDDPVYPYKEYIMNLSNLIQPSLTGGYLGYFVLGHYLCKYNISDKVERLINIGAIISVVLGVYLCQYYSIKNNEPVEEFYLNFTITALLISVSMFLLFKNHVSRIQFGPKAERRILNLGTYTFGIYLIHIFVRDILQMMGLNSLSFNTAVAIPSITLVIFMICIIAVAVLKRIPLVGKWII